MLLNYYSRTTHLFNFLMWVNSGFIFIMYFTYHSITLFFINAVNYFTSNYLTRRRTLWSSSSPLIASIVFEPTKSTNQINESVHQFYKLQNNFSKNNFAKEVISSFLFSIKNILNIYVCIYSLFFLYNFQLNRNIIFIVFLLLKCV